VITCPLGKWGQETDLVNGNGKEGEREKRGVGK